MLLLSFSSSSVAAMDELPVLPPRNEQPRCDGQSQGKVFVVLRQSDRRHSRAQTGKSKRPGPRPAALGKARTNIPLGLIRLRLRVGKVTACPESAGWSRGPKSLSLEEVVPGGAWSEGTVIPKQGDHTVSTGQNPKPQTGNVHRNVLLSEAPFGSRQLWFSQNFVCVRESPPGRPVHPGSHYLHQPCPGKVLMVARTPGPWPRP